MKRSCALALSAVALIATVAAQTAGARARDRTPPRFAGLTEASTCIPGPIGGEKAQAVFHLTWSAAKDNRTPASRIRYDVYQATSPGGEDYSTPTYTTRGATTFATPPLTARGAYYFVVRARDLAGNRDRNTRERLGTNVCL